MGIAIAVLSVLVVLYCSDPHVMDHERGKIGESFILTDQGYHTLMDVARNSVVEALMRVGRMGGLITS